MDDSTFDLERITAELAKVVDAGLLTDLKEEIAYALRGLPRSDFDTAQGLAQERNVKGFGDLLSCWTGLPVELCELAALNQLLPGNRHRTALEVLREFANRLKADAVQQKASTILAAERRRYGQ